MKTKKNMKIILAGLMIILAVGLKAQDWQYLTANSEGNSIYIRSGKESTFIKEVWVKTTGKKIVVKKNGKSIVYKNGYTLVLMQCMCYMEMYKTIAYYEYSSEGKVLNMEEYNELAVESNKVVPETLGELIFKWSCE
jgi:hypothetical protein